MCYTVQVLAFNYKIPNPNSHVCWGHSSTADQLELLLLHMGTQRVQYAMIKFNVIRLNHMNQGSTSRVGITTW